MAVQTPRRRAGRLLRRRGRRLCVPLERALRSGPLPPLQKVGHRGARAAAVLRWAVLPPLLVLPCPVAAAPRLAVRVAAGRLLCQFGRRSVRPLG